MAEYQQQEEKGVLLRDTIDCLLDGVSKVATEMIHISCIYTYVFHIRDFGHPNQQKRRIGLPILLMFVGAGCI